MFTGNTGRSSGTTAPTTSQRQPWEESMNTPSSWTRNGWRNQVISHTPCRFHLNRPEEMPSCGVKGRSFAFPDYSLEDYKKCTQAGLKVGANIFGVYVSAGVHGGSCNGLLNEMGGEIPLQKSILQVSEPNSKVGLVYFQRAREVAAWWRTLCRWSEVEPASPSRLSCRRSSPPQS